MISSYLCSLLNFSNPVCCHKCGLESKNSTRRLASEVEINFDLAESPCGRMGYGCDISRVTEGPADSLVDILIVCLFSVSIVVLFCITSCELSTLCCTGSALVELCVS